MRSMVQKWLYTMSFKNRIRTVFLCLLILAVAATGVTSYFIVSNVLEEQALTQSQNALNKSARVLDEKLTKILVFMMTMTMSQPFKDMMSDAATYNHQEYYTHLSKMQVLLEQFYLNEPSIHSVLVSTTIGDFYSTTKRRLFERSFEDTALFEQFMKVKDEQRIYWSEEHQDELFAGGSHVVSLVFEPYIKDVHTEAYIIVNVDASRFYEVLVDREDMSSQNPLVLIDHQNSVFKYDSDLLDLLASSDLSEQLTSVSGNDYFMYTHQKDDYLVNFATLRSYEDWTLVTIQPKKELLQLIDGIRWSAIIIVLICAVLVIIISNILTTILFRPLNQMQFLMNMVSQSNLHLRFKSDYNDEISQMGEKFNDMLDEINRLIERNRQMEKDKHIAEIKALQAQINPHFLSNSLHAIFLLCMDNQYDRAKDMVVSLSSLFELGLNRGLEVTTIEQELNHVEHYLNIQQACYPNLFEYHIHVADQALLAFPMLKIMLQPLVENSIMHGFKNRTIGGLIDILVTEEDQGVCLTVQDNGIGMDADDVYRKIQDPSSDSYALRNVYNRLKLYYGDFAQLTLLSKPNQTQVRLFIPTWIGGNDHE